MMKCETILRVARPTDRLGEIASMYVRGLGLRVLAEFSDHDGFDGMIVGHPRVPYHLEFTTQRGHIAGRSPSAEHLLVFYIPERREWEMTCQQMVEAGFLAVPSANPYWDARGRTFEDLDGYRVVLENAAWSL